MKSVKCRFEINCDAEALHLENTHIAVQHKYPFLSRGERIPKFNLLKPNHLSGSEVNSANR
jgi:hypothetical protein